MPTRRSARSRGSRVGVHVAVTLAVVVWAVIVALAALVVGYLRALADCPNVGPGIYWGEPEPTCAAGHYRRATGFGVLVWVTPLLSAAGIRWWWRRDRPQ